MLLVCLCVLLVSLFVRGCFVLVNVASLFALLLVFMFVIVVVCLTSLVLLS